jgi:predicted dehydrogenase
MSARNLLDELRRGGGTASGERCEPVRTAVVGVGYWGPNLVRNLHELPEAEVVCVCDRRQDALQAIGRRYPSAALTTDFEEVLGYEEVEAVVIATPVASHYRLAEAAISAGKHVFVEKPLAGSYEQALALSELARKADRVVMPGHTFLYSPPVDLVHNLIASGALGEIYFISTSRVNLGLHQPDISVVWDLGPHDISILRYWLDDLPTQVTAMSRGCVVPTVPDVAFVNLCFGDGVMAQLELSWLAPSKLRRTAVVGSRKMVVYDDTSTEPVRIFDSGVSLPDPETFGEYRLTYRTGDIVSPRVDPTEPLALEMLDFCSSIRSGGSPRSSAGIGVDVVRIVEAADRSIAAGGVPVSIEPGRGDVAALASVGRAAPELDTTGLDPRRD